MLHIPSVLQFSPVQGLQVIRPLPSTIDNSIGSFLIGAQFPMRWVLGCQRDLLQDEIPYVETHWLHHCIILPSHEVFVLRCPMLCIHPYLVYKIKVQTELLSIIFFLIHHHLVIGQVHFYRHDCFASIC